MKRTQNNRRLDQSHMPGEESGSKEHITQGHIRTHFTSCLKQSSFGRFQDS